LKSIPVSSGFSLLPMAIMGNWIVILPIMFNANYHWTN
jgi:hypothetical protein